MTPEYNVRWSKEDHKWVGSCKQHPRISHRENTALGALSGIMELAHMVSMELAEEDLILNVGELQSSDMLSTNGGW